MASPLTLVTLLLALSTTLPSLHGLAFNRRRPVPRSYGLSLSRDRLGLLKDRLRVKAALSGGLPQALTDLYKSGEMPDLTQDLLNKAAMADEADQPVSLDDLGPWPGFVSCPTMEVSAICYQCTAMDPPSFWKVHDPCCREEGRVRRLCRSWYVEESSGGRPIG